MTWPAGSVLHLGIGAQPLGIEGSRPELFHLGHTKALERPRIYGIYAV